MILTLFLRIIIWPFIFGYGMNIMSMRLLILANTVIWNGYRGKVWLYPKTVGLMQFSAHYRIYILLLLMIPVKARKQNARTQAVILDHLMPAMTRAENYGELLHLEQLVDEYYQAMGLDHRT